METDAQDLAFSLEDRGFAAFAHERRAQPDEAPPADGARLAEATPVPPPPRAAPGRLDLRV